MVEIEAAELWQEDQELPKSNYIIQDIKCGLHSGFAPCCILFYITAWTWLVKKLGFHGGPANQRWYPLYQRYFDWYKVDYIMCPLCKIFNLVRKVNRCSCERNCC